MGTHSIGWRETVSRWREAEAALIDGSASDRPDLWIPGDALPRNCLVYRRPPSQLENRLEPILEGEEGRCKLLFPIVEVREVRSEIEKEMYIVRAIEKFA